MPAQAVKARTAGSAWLLGVALLVSSCRAQTGRSLDAQMKRLRVRSALVVAAHALDERPVWSPRGDALAFNTGGHWAKVRLQPVTLSPGTWMGKEAIGVVQSPLRTRSERESVVKEWERSSRYGDREVTTRDGATVELKQGELGTSFIVARPGRSPETIWSSRTSNCYALALSPDEHMVAYICEQIGLVVTEP